MAKDFWKLFPYIWLKYTMEEPLKKKIKEEAERIEEDSLYSAKGHFYAAQLWVNLRLWLGIPAAVLAAIAGTAALSKFDHHNVVAGVLSIIVAALTTVLTFLNPNEKASAHQKAGNDYNSLKNEARIFHDIGAAIIAEEEDPATSLRELSQKRDAMNKEHVQIPKWAFKKAKKGIEEGEAAYKVDGSHKVE